MHEFAALVEERGVVLIRLDHEQRRRGERSWPGQGPYGCAQTRGYAEVHRHTAHQEAGRQARAFQNPGQHGRGGRLAVRAGDGQHMAALQHMRGQPLRPAGIRCARVEDGLHQRKLRHAVRQPRAADHVAHHEHVRLQRELVGAIAFDQLYSQGAQLVAHGRVDAGVAAGDTVARLARQRGQAAHERAADAQDVYMHGSRFYGPRWNLQDL